MRERERERGDRERGGDEGEREGDSCSSDSTAHTRADSKGSGQNESISERTTD